MCYVETQNKTPSSGYCKGFFIYLPKTVFCGCAAWGGLFFVIHKRARNCIMLMRVWNFSF